jgi:signal transduction histidine kinase
LDARRRREVHDSYDSGFGLPDFTGGAPPPEPLSSTFRAAADSSVELPITDDVVAVHIRTNALREQVLAALSGRNLTVLGDDVVPHAALVIADANIDVATEMAQLRRRTRPDAAILLVLGTPSGEAVAKAHEAGAFACLRTPLVPEELVGLLTAALHSRAARVQAADLARQLDLESHLASIGRISAGLSHEVGSPLGAAALNMEIVQRECARLVQALKWLAYSPPEEISHRLQIAREHIPFFESPEGLAGAIRDAIAAHERLKELFKTLRGLVGRAHGVRREPVEVLSIVQETRSWLVDELSGVEVEVVGEPVRALADRTLLGQLLHNLVSNAAQAAKTLSAPRIRLHVYARGEHAVVSVRDNGPGIPPELQEKIFEPFFTTRRGKGGIGLGLALCREYALQMRAELSVWSLPGRGACFRVYLPGCT